MPKLEEVFKLSGVPTYTFVKPAEYDKLLVALRTPGRGVVVEGPSGIGKTTAVRRALEELRITANVSILSPRIPDDLEYIQNPPEIAMGSTIIVDDFHRLDQSTKEKIANFLKVLADTEETGTKLVIIGINRAGESLISVAGDIAARLDIIGFEINSDAKVSELVKKGEQFLNVKFTMSDDIVSAANGSFYLAQFLSHETCLTAGVLESPKDTRELAVSFEGVKDKVLTTLGQRFKTPVEKFAKGTRLRREGRAPYLQILKWLADSNEWSIRLDREVPKHRELRGSVGQVVEKGYLQQLIKAIMP